MTAQHIQPQKVWKFYNATVNDDDDDDDNRWPYEGPFYFTILLDEVADNAWLL